MKSKWTALVPLVFVTQVTCDSTGPSKHPAVIVDPPATMVVVSRTVLLVATQEDGTGGASFTWVSSNPGIATVNSNGLVTGLSPGAVTIKATSGSSVGTSSVTVLESGSLEVHAVTTGAELDPDGYAVQVDGRSQNALGINGTVSYPVIAAGERDVKLLGIDSNCTVDGANPRTVNVPARGTAETTFAVSCRQRSDLIVRMLDVGRGDAIYIENGTSKVVIDGGASDTRYRQLLDSLNIRNTTLDAVILTHAQKDHASGLRELFTQDRGIRIRYYFDNLDDSPSSSVPELRDSANARVARGELVYRDSDDPCGDGSSICTLSLDGGAKLHVLRPDPNGPDLDNRSIPVKLIGPDSASFTMWLAGDAERSEIQWFETGAGYHVSPGMNVNVLKGQRHGECKAVSNRLLTLTSPEWTIYSLEDTDGSGRIHNQTKNLLAARNVPWYRTDQNGTITIIAPANGAGYSVRGERGVTNMSGSSDSDSDSSACNPIP